MIDLGKTSDRTRLATAVRGSVKRLRSFRENRLDLLRQYVGKHYGEGGTIEMVPVDLLALFCSIMLQNLVGNVPRVLVSTHAIELKPKAYKLQLALDYLLDQLVFARVMTDTVMDALFGIGIVKVGLMRTSATVEIEGFRHDIGQPCADTVSLDDWVHDTTARRYEQVQFAGNRYRLPYEDVVEASTFEKKAVDRLKPTSKYEQRVEGDSTEKAEDLGHGHPGIADDEYKEYVELYDLWLPQEQQFITVPVEDFDNPLRVMDWDGPDNGPYHLLNFNPVPDNIMGLPALALLQDLHDLINKVFSKLGRQANRQKSLLGFTAATEDDARRIQSAADGDIIRIERSDKAEELKFGGIDQAGFAFFTQLRGLFSYLAGNLDALGGLGPQAQTYSQDRLLSSTASKQLERMQKEELAFFQNVIRDLGWYLWTDPLIELPLVKRIPGTDIELPVKWTGDDQAGAFFDYNIRIEPYSLQYQSPTDRIQTLTGILERVVLPLAGQIQEQGGQIDMNALLTLLGRYADMPELADVVKFQGITEQPERQPAGGGGGEQARKSPTSRRVYERVGRPGMTRAGQDAVLMQALLGKEPQAAEAIGAAEAGG